jgi:hypothetical protein
MNERLFVLKKDMLAINSVLILGQARQGDVFMFLGDSFDYCYMIKILHPRFGVCYFLNDFSTIEVKYPLWATLLG